MDGDRRRAGGGGSLWRAGRGTGYLGASRAGSDVARAGYVTSLEHPEDAVPDDQLRKLGRLVAAYDSGLAIPLSPSERAALPMAMARQPLWSIGGWVATLDDEAAARRHVAGTAGEV